MMEYAICPVAAAPMRKEASHRSEMVSQVLFGELVEILEAQGEWFRIRCLYDAYEGWITHHLIEQVDEQLATRSQNFVAKGLVNPVTLPDQLINAPMGAALTGFNEETRLLWDESYKYHGTYRDIRKRADNDLLVNLVHPWLSAPYLWGGRTMMGVDCSGFVQTIFRVLGIPLKRDAWQQATEGNSVSGIEEAKQGDLAFFQNEKGRVIHVGIVLQGGRIIHASGKVRIDTLDAKGIVQQSGGKRTHQFHSVRRYF